MTSSYIVENNKHSLHPSVSSRIRNGLGFLKYHPIAPKHRPQHQGRSATICWANPTANLGGLFHRLLQKPSLRVLVHQRALLAPCPRRSNGCRIHNTALFAGAADNEILDDNEDDLISEDQDVEAEDVQDQLDELDSDFEGDDDTTVAEHCSSVFDIRAL